MKPIEIISNAPNLNLFPSVYSVFSVFSVVPSSLK